MFTRDCVCWFEGNEDGGLPSARAIPEGVLPPGVGGKLLADVLGLMVLGNLLGGVWQILTQYCWQQY